RTEFSRRSCPSKSSRRGGQSHFGLLDRANKLRSLIVNRHVGCGSLLGAFHRRFRLVMAFQTKLMWQGGGWSVTFMGNREVTGIDGNRHPPRRKINASRLPNVDNARLSIFDPYSEIGSPCRRDRRRSMDLES